MRTLVFDDLGEEEMAFPETIPLGEVGIGGRQVV